MALSDLISSVDQNGFWQGMQNYVGNNTDFGQTVNGLDNSYNKAVGNPQSQLIGNPQSITPTQASAVNPAMTPQVPVKPDVNSMIKAHATGQQGPQTPDLSQVFLQPTSTNQPQSQDQQTPLASSSKGTGRDAAALGMLLL